VDACQIVSYVGNVLVTVLSNIEQKQVNFAYAYKKNQHSTTPVPTAKNPTLYRISETMTLLLI